MLGSMGFACQGDVQGRSCRPRVGRAGHKKISGLRKGLPNVGEKSLVAFPIASGGAVNAGELFEGPPCDGGLRGREISLQSFP